MIAYIIIAFLLGYIFANKQVPAAPPPPSHPTPVNPPPQQVPIPASGARGQTAPASQAQPLEPVNRSVDPSSSNADTAEDDGWGSTGTAGRTTISQWDDGTVNSDNLHQEEDNDTKDTDNTRDDGSNPWQVNEDAHANNDLADGGWGWDDGREFHHTHRSKGSRQKPPHLDKGDNDDWASSSSSGYGSTKSRQTSQQRSKRATSRYEDDVSSASSQTGGMRGKGWKAEKDLCVECGRPFPSAMALQLHISQVHRQAPTVRGTNFGPTVTCEICENVLSSRLELRNHKKAVHDWSMLCTMCLTTFQDGFAALEHYQLDHNAGDVDFETIAAFLVSIKSPAAVEPAFQSSDDSSWTSGPEPASTSVSSEAPTWSEGGDSIAAPLSASQTFSSRDDGWASPAPAVLSPTAHAFEPRSGSGIRMIDLSAQPTGPRELDIAVEREPVFEPEAFSPAPVYHAPAVNDRQDPFAPPPAVSPATSHSPPADASAKADDSEVASTKSSEGRPWPEGDDLRFPRHLPVAENHQEGPCDPTPPSVTADNYPPLPRSNKTSPVKGASPELAEPDAEKPTEFLPPGLPIRGAWANGRRLSDIKVETTESTPEAEAEPEVESDAAGPIALDQDEAHVPQVDSVVESDPAPFIAPEEPAGTANDAPFDPFAPVAYTPVILDAPMPHDGKDEEPAQTDDLFSSARLVAIQEPKEIITPQARQSRIDDEEIRPQTPEPMLKERPMAGHAVPTQIRSASPGRPAASTSPFGSAPALAPAPAPRRNIFAFEEQPEDTDLVEQLPSFDFPTSPSKFSAFSPQRPPAQLVESTPTVPLQKPREIQVGPPLARLDDSWISQASTPSMGVSSASSSSVASLLSRSASPAFPPAPQTAQDLRPRLLYNQPEDNWMSLHPSNDPVPPPPPARPSAREMTLQDIAKQQGQRKIEEARARTKGKKTAPRMSGRVGRPQQPLEAKFDDEWTSFGGETTARGQGGAVKKPVDTWGTPVSYGQSTEMYGGW